MDRVAKARPKSLTANAPYPKLKAIPIKCRPRRREEVLTKIPISMQTPNNSSNPALRYIKMSCRQRQRSSPRRQESSPLRRSFEL